jgi:hypothetical protein
MIESIDLKEYFQIILPWGVSFQIYIAVILTVVSLLGFPKSCSQLCRGREDSFHDQRALNQASQLCKEPQSLPLHPENV